MNDYVFLGNQSPNGNHTKGIKIMSLNSRQLAVSFTIKSHNVEFSPANRYLLSCCEFNGSIQMFRVESES